MAPEAVQRHAQLLVIMAELALTTWDDKVRTSLPPEMRQVLAELALDSPAAAARHSRLLTALPGSVRREVLALASEPPGTGAVLTVCQAATLLGIGERAVRKRCQRGQLTATKHKISGQWRIDGTDLG
jgi:Helix-turn-helix domain